MKKLPYERQQEILELLKQHDFMDIGELSRRLNVSYMTVHRDLEELAKNGKASRVYGGAKRATAETISSDTDLGARLVYDLTIEERFRISMESKRLIAMKAATYVREGDVIGLDASTTTLHMCGFISEMRITVITNSISVALQLSTSPYVNVLVTGGNLRKSALTLLGPRVADQLSMIYMDKCFLSSSALSYPKGLMDLSMEEPEAKRCFIRHSREAYALVDESKIGSSAPFVVCEPSELTALITTSQKEMTEEQRKLMNHFRKDGLPIVMAE